MSIQTGDIEGNIERLLREVVGKAHYHGEIDYEGLRAGNPKAFIPLLRHILLIEWKEIASLVISHECSISTARTERQFIAGVWKFIREVLNFRPSLTIEQFLSSGFAERKLILTSEIGRICRIKLREIIRDSKPMTANSQSRSDKVEMISCEVVAANRFGNPTIQQEVQQQREVVVMAIDEREERKGLRKAVNIAEQNTIVTVIEGLRKAVEVIAKRIEKIEEQQLEQIRIQQQLKEQQIQSMISQIQELNERIQSLENKTNQQQQQQPPGRHSNEEGTDEFIERMSRRLKETRQQWTMK